MSGCGRSRVGARALASILSVASTSARADLPVERIGIGVALASPVVGPSLFLKLDERWSAGIGLGEDAGDIGGQVQVDYARGGSRGSHWQWGGGTPTFSDRSAFEARIRSRLRVGGSDLSDPSGLCGRRLVPHAIDLEPG